MGPIYQIQIQIFLNDLALSGIPQNFEIGPIQILDWSHAVHIISSPFFFCNDKSDSGNNSDWIEIYTITKEKDINNDERLRF